MYPAEIAQPQHRTTQGRPQPRRDPGPQLVTREQAHKTIVATVTVLKFSPAPLLRLQACGHSLTDPQSWLAGTPPGAGLFLERAASDR